MHLVYLRTYVAAKNISSVGTYIRTYKTIFYFTKITTFNDIIGCFINSPSSTVVSSNLRRSCAWTEKFFLITIGDCIFVVACRALYFTICWFFLIMVGRAVGRKEVFCRYEKLRTAHKDFLGVALTCCFPSWITTPSRAVFG